MKKAVIFAALLARLDLEEDGEMADEDDTALDLRGRAPGGVGGWLEEEEDEWRDEVGESYYLDMLRDDARNQGALAPRRLLRQRAVA